MTDSCQDSCHGPVSRGLVPHTGFGLRAERMAVSRVDSRAEWGVPGPTSGRIVARIVASPDGYKGFADLRIVRPTLAVTHHPCSGVVRRGHVSASCSAELERI